MRARGLSAAAFMAGFSSGGRDADVPLVNGNRALRYDEVRKSVVDSQAIRNGKLLAVAVWTDRGWVDPFGGVFMVSDIERFSALRNAVRYQTSAFKPATDVVVGDVVHTEGGCHIVVCSVNRSAGGVRMFDRDGEDIGGGVTLTADDVIEVTS